MSVVGELPVDVSGPPRFSSAQFEFDLKKCGHSRQPSHRRTASRVMMYYDENFLDFGLEPQRPGTPTAAAGQAHNPFADILAKEEISWGKVEEVEGLPTRPILTRSSIRSSEGSSMKGGDRPDVEELFGKHWAGLARGSGSLGSSQGTPKSVRSNGSPVKRFFDSIFKSRKQNARSSTLSQDGFMNGSMDCADALPGTTSCDQDEPTEFQIDDDCESVDTVIEYDVESDDSASSQAEDANMRTDLYTEIDKTSTGDDTVTSDSIDEEEFPLDTIVESSQELQKCQEPMGLESPSGGSIVLFRETMDNNQALDDSDSVRDGACCGTCIGSPKCSHVHSHTISDLSQPESDMLLPEIVTGGILQSLHDEINRNISDPGAEDDSLLSCKPSCEESHHDTQNVEATNAIDLTKKQMTMPLETRDEVLYLGVRWVRLVPDKDLVTKVQTGAAKAAEILSSNWRWIPFVAMPLLHLAIHL